VIGDLQIVGLAFMLGGIGIEVVLIRLHIAAIRKLLEKR
jgi:hypothetical protein